MMYHNLIETLKPVMAENPPSGDGHRVGVVKGRSHTQTLSGAWLKHDTATGRFMDVKTSSPTPFKGVRRENERG